MSLVLNNLVREKQVRIQRKKIGFLYDIFVETCLETREHTFIGIPFKDLHYTGPVSRTCKIL